MKEDIRNVAIVLAIPLVIITTSIVGATTESLYGDAFGTLIGVGYGIISGIVAISLILKIQGRNITAFWKSLI